VRTAKPNASGAYSEIAVPIKPWSSGMRLEPSGRFTLDPRQLRGFEAKVIDRLLDRLAVRRREVCLGAASLRLASAHIHQRKGPAEA